MGNENSGKISLMKRMHVLFKGRFPIAEKTQESIVVRSLKRQLKVQEEIIEKQATLMEQMTDQMTVHNQGSTQDKILDMIGGMFKNNQPIKNDVNTAQPIQTTLITESGQKLIQDVSDQQIEEIICSYDPTVIKGGLILGDNFIKEKVKSDYPQLSDDIISRGIEIARGMFGEQ
jgi:hypothetical protein